MHIIIANYGTIIQFFVVKRIFLMRRIKFFGEVILKLKMYFVLHKPGNNTPFNFPK
jgi:hypothetical protein